MENIIMPEIMTPAFVELLASKPELLEQLMGTRPDEEIIKGKNVELNSYDMPQDLKFLFCNVTIKLYNSENADWEALGTEDANEDICADESVKNDLQMPLDKEGIRTVTDGIRVIEQQLAKRNRQVEGLSKEVEKLKEKSIILETRMKETKNTLKLFLKEFFNRKLSYRYKSNVNYLAASLDNQNKLLADKTWLLEQEKKNRDALAEKRRYLIKLIMKYVEENSI
ncbi:MAG TPA: hypothetical protein VEG39_01410 [Clostridia bacterium]|nr:hypothetical protein [Clostridia bacterium]